MQSKPTIYLPVQNLKNPFFRHAGDTFRETVGLWEERGLVNVVLSDNPYVWLGEEETDEGVVLYDRPTLQWWQQAPPQKYKLVLFGNTMPPPTAITRAFPWIFWGRRPRLLAAYEHQPTPSYHARPIQSIFLGKIENTVQQHYRREPERWRNVVEEFDLVIGKDSIYRYTQSEYLEQLRKAKFGLCLRGYGPKCNREIELMALGTVPIVTPEVDMLAYFDPPRENIHYLKVNDPSELAALIASVTPQQWEEMSQNCVDWYMRNCSVLGSFYTTMRLVQTLSTAQLKGLPVRMAQSVPPKIEGIKRVVIDTVFFERPFSGISRVWLGLLESLMECIPNVMLNERSERIEVVLLLREKANVPSNLLQRFSFIGIPTFDYATEADDVMHLNRICKDMLQADLFVSSYYTYTTAVDCMGVVHDMIPERFKMTKGSDAAMWAQKDRCFANAKWFVCVSESTQSDLFRYCPTSNAQNTRVVPNSFNPNVFSGVDQELNNPELAKRAIKAELGVQTPFVLIIASNTNAYKNIRLAVDMIRMNADYFKQPNGLQIVLLTNHAAYKPQLPEDTKFKVISSVKDRQLGLLYGLASALVYPSRYEGFGLPVLEAFWSECPVICSRQSGSIPEIGGDACFYVSPDDPSSLFKVLVDVTSGAIEEVVREKAALGIKRLEHYTPERQLQGFLQCVGGALSGQFKALSPSSTLPNEAMQSQTPQNEVPKNEVPKNEVSKNEVSKNEVSKNEAPKSDARKFKGIHVIVQYFLCSNEERQAEYDFCVQANLANPNVTRIHCLLDASFAGNSTNGSSYDEAPSWLSTHPKYVQYRVPSRLTYKQAFDYVNSHIPHGEVCALMNLDIFIDHATDWSTTAYTTIRAPDTPETYEESLLDVGVVLCLSRHEFDGIGASTKDPKLQNLAYCNAQDCWIFKAPLHVEDCDFKMGMLGCDNAIAHRLKQSGYIPVNSPNEFKVHHYDVCRQKDGSNYLQHHRPNPERPEDRGMYLVPDYDAIRSVDDLIDRLGLGQMHRYRVICDVMSNYIQISNPTTEGVD